MPNDCIMVWRDYHEERLPHRGGPLHCNREPSYSDFLARTYERFHEGEYTPETLPEKPETLSPLQAYVNHGRWVVVCDCGGSAAPVEPREDYLCHTCEEWHSVQFPENRAEIEAGLLALPGFRHRAPERNWTP